MWGLNTRSCRVNTLCRLSRSVPGCSIVTLTPELHRHDLHTASLPLFQVLIPKMIALTNLQIHKQLSFGYDIGKGYVVGEEAVGRIIDHISDDFSISQVDQVSVLG